MSGNGVFAVHTRDGHWVVPPGAVLHLGPGQEPRVCKTQTLRLIHVAFEGDLPVANGLYVATSLIQELLESLAQTGQANIDDRRAVLLAELLEETSMLTAQAVPPCLLMPSDRRLIRICQYVVNNLDTPRTLQDWADELEHDPRTLHRLFVREFGMSFVQWRQQARLIAALEWLASGQAVMDVALDLGYQTQSAFSAMFRRHMGMTPSQWQGRRQAA
ncbi:MAG: AraC family transcriptional regulator [Castellaniella sp.]